MDAPFDFAVCFFALVILFLRRLWHQGRALNEAERRFILRKRREKTGAK